MVIITRALIADEDQRGFEKNAPPQPWTPKKGALVLLISIMLKYLQSSRKSKMEWKDIPTSSAYTNRDTFLDLMRVYGGFFYIQKKNNSHAILPWR